MTSASNVLPTTITDANAGKIPQSLRALLDLRARENAGRPFLIAPESETHLHFAALHHAVSAMRAMLADRGMRPGSRVAVLLANGVGAALSLLSVMTAGAVAVPINPHLAQEEIAALLTQSKAELLICDAAAQSALPPVVRALQKDHVETVAVASGLFLVRLTDQGAASRVAQHELPDWNDAALVLYTSGTTGSPKGVVLSHGNLLTNAGLVARAHRLKDEDRALCVLPLYHINGLVVTLITPLLTGGAVVMPLRFRARHFWHWASEYRVTWFSAVPTILSILLSQQDPPSGALAGLRFARSASAPLPVAVLEQFERRFGVPVIETYGISEAAGQVCANPLPPLARKSGSAGVPFGNELAVVDCHGKPVPAGAEGEVAIRGANVFSGYLDNPAADRECLRKGWFRTGDLGYLDSDGYLFLTGRKKELINRAGEKIAPREVEEVIHRLPAVEAVGVAGIPHGLYGEEVAAFVTLREGQRLDPCEVQQICLEHLAPFKMPREVLFLKDLPKGPSGKIQRRRLVELYLARHEQGGGPSSLTPCTESSCGA